MKHFKLYDLIIQSFLIVGALLAFARWPIPETPIFGYFAVGGWQVVSMVVHWIARYDMRWWSHRAVHTAVMCILPFGVLFGFIDPDTTIMLLVILYFASPALAIWYWTLCYLEWKRLQRPAVISG